MRNSLHKNERLRSRKTIAGLLNHGRAFSRPPFRVVWQESNLNALTPAQVMFAVPKKKIKKAVQRNTLKRRMREAFRKNKSNLYKALISSGKHITVAFIYTSQAESDYPEIEHKIILSLHRLAEEVKK